VGEGALRVDERIPRRLEIHEKKRNKQQCGE
jgi:hypothetical protein